jgi:hypothetical protein
MLNHSYDRPEKEITDDIRTRFLLAQLLMDSFREKLTVRDVKSALQGLPRGSDAYDVASHAAMERIFAQGEGSGRMAKKILAWILRAHRPLSTLELLHALAVEPGDTKVEEDNVLEAEQLLTLCSGLVTIDEQSDSVRFIHYTTQEYLQRNQQTWLPYAKIEITRSCTAYLSCRLSTQRNRLCFFARPNAAGSRTIQSSHSVEPPGQGLAVDPIVPCSCDLASPSTLDIRVSSAELQGPVLAQWLELGRRALAQLETRPPDFLGRFEEKCRRGGKPCPSQV